MSNNWVKIDKINITQFRRFHDVAFDIGPSVTLIAGQNATSKSTLLGMLCQPFSFGAIRGKTAGHKDSSKYTSNYHGLNLADYKDLTGNTFNYDCEDVFRLSNVHDTIDKKYSYHLHLSGKCITPQSPIYKEGLLVRAQLRPDKKRIRFVAGPGISSEAGEGNFPHPVIYFGLNRHWPLALVKGMNTDIHPEINSIDEDWYIEKYRKILRLVDEHSNKAEFIKPDKSIKSKKDFIGVSGQDYNSESFSAGQDNLGQILTAILSFKLLKSKLGDKYQGGLILIDEIDSTLHAISQVELLKILCEAAEHYQLQIVATTHSLYLLQQAFQSKLKKQVKVIYLNREDKLIVDSGYSSFDEIENNLKIQAQPKATKKHKKVSLIFEDQVGKNMFFSLIGNSLNSYFNRVEMDSLDAGSLKNLASLSSRVPELKKVILIPDGDMRNTIGSKYENLVFLPGTSRPETLLFQCLNSLKEADYFWKKCPAIGYSKQVAMTGHDSSEFKEEKTWHKRWYSDQSQYWGQMNKVAFLRWADTNKALCKQFCQEFFKVLRRVAPEANIPKETTESILKKYS